MDKYSMRIISGSARGRKLKTPDANFSTIKPTSDRVKESIFNIIQFDIEGRQVLDLYAGTGQLGIEALSRGAKSAAFADSSAGATRLIRDNLRLCGFSDISAVYTTDVLRYLEYDEKYDLIFIDPPYDTDLLSETVIKAIRFDKLNVNGIIICESKVNTGLPEILPPYRLDKKYKYGQTEITKIIRPEDGTTI